MSRNRWIRVPSALTLVLLLGVGAVTARAQPPGEPPPAFLARLYPPDLVMRHQQAIGLREDQREAISDAIRATQASVLDLQWQIQHAAHSLEALLESPPVDESAALAQATRLLEREQGVKRAHLGLLIRILNQLDPEQRAALDRLRGP